MWCPFIAAALISNGGKKSIDEIRGTAFLDCLETLCQMWDKETKDCGLKQVPVVPVLSEIKSTLEGISQDVNVIRSNVE